MIFIITEGGELLNLQHVTAITGEAVEAGAGYVVLAHMVTGETHVVSSLDSWNTCQEIIGHIVRRLEANGSAFVMKFNVGGEDDEVRRDIFRRLEDTKGQRK